MCTLLSIEFLRKTLIKNSNIYTKDDIERYWVPHQSKIEMNGNKEFSSVSEMTNYRNSLLGILTKLVISGMLIMFYYWLSNKKEKEKRKRMPQFVVFACFPGLSYPAIASFKLSMWCVWMWSWGMMFTICSLEPWVQIQCIIACIGKKKNGSSNTKYPFPQLPLFIPIWSLNIKWVMSAMIVELLGIYYIWWIYS